MVEVVVVGGGGVRVVGVGVVVGVADTERAGKNNVNLLVL